MTEVTVGQSPLGYGGDDRLAQLRRAFDAAFSAPPSRPPDDLTDLLAVTVDGHPLAVPLTAMSGLVADRAVTPVPSSPRDLLGVAGLRGQLVPVYSLAGLLGLGAAAGGPAPRWLVLAAGSPVFAVAVDSVDGHLRVSGEAIARPAGSTTASTVVRTADGPRPVVDMPTVRARVTAAVTGHTAGPATHTAGPQGADEEA